LWSSWGWGKGTHPPETMNVLPSTFMIVEIGHLEEDSSVESTWKAEVLTSLSIRIPTLQLGLALEETKERWVD